LKLSLSIEYYQLVSKALYMLRGLVAIGLESGVWEVEILISASTQNSGAPRIC
jgi:hypothetical protein